MIEGYRKSLVQTLEERGKEELNRRVAFMGIAIAECDELLNLCRRLNLVRLTRNRYSRELGMARNDSITAERKNSDYADLQKRSWLSLTKSGPASMPKTTK